MLLGLFLLAFVVGMPIALLLLLERVKRLEREVGNLKNAERRVGIPAQSAAPATQPQARERPIAARAAAAEPSAPTQASAAETPAAAREPRPAFARTRGAPSLAEWTEPGYGSASSAAASEPPPAARPDPRPRIELERWLGVRGAGVLGGIFAALAAVLLFRHAIQEGWITAGMRVGLGIAGGLALACAGEWLRPRGYRYAPEALIGAGAVAHYASLWSAAQLYGLVPLPVSFVLMALVTAAACALALRHRSVLIALIALVGGFATPLLLATEQDRPFGLFGYLLLLDLGLLLVGRRLATPWIGLGALLGTTLLQALWLGQRHVPGGELLALSMLALFAALFAFPPRRAEPDAHGESLRAAGLLLPFLLALYVSTQGGLALELWPLLGFALLLLAAACVLSKQPGLEQLSSGAVSGALALLASWMLGRALDASDAWGLALGAPLVAATPLAFLPVAQRAEAGAARAPRTRALRTAAALACVGLAALFLLLAFAPGAAPFEALVAGVGATFALALALARFGGEAFALPVVGLLAGAALTAQLGVQTPAHAPGSFVALAGLTSLAALGHLGALAQATTRARAAALLAVGLYALLPLFAHQVLAPLGGLVAPLRLAGVGLLALAALAAARRGGWTALLAAALLASAVALNLPGHAVTDAARESLTRPWGALSRLLVLGLALGAAFALAPLPGSARSVPRGSVWLCGFAPLVFALALYRPLHGLGWFPGEPWLPGAFFLVAWPCALRVGRRVAEARSAHGLAAILLAALALARGIDIHPGLVAPGLAAAGAALLWRRTGHPALRAVAVAAALAALVVCAIHFVQPGFYRRSGVVLFNGLALAHALALGGASLLAAVLARAAGEPADESKPPAFGARLAAPLAGIAAAGILFLWLTLTVMELWSAGPRVTFPHPRVATFDLTLSLTWAAYGLALLALGLVRRSPGPRWASLAVLLLAIGKVFLRDLGDLEGLARVGSLAGLALSLTLVSLLYQRFVFGRAPAA